MERDTTRNPQIQRVSWILCNIFSSEKRLVLSSPWTLVLGLTARYAAAGSSTPYKRIPFFSRGNCALPVIVSGIVSLLSTATYPATAHHHSGIPLQSKRVSRENTPCSFFFRRKGEHINNPWLRSILVFVSSGSLLRNLVWSHQNVCGRAACGNRSRHVFCCFHTFLVVDRGLFHASRTPSPRLPIIVHPFDLNDFHDQVSVCRQHGVRGMYQGMRAKLLHTVLTSALLFLGYERLVEVNRLLVLLIISLNVFCFSTWTSPARSFL